MQTSITSKIYVGFTIAVLLVLLVGYFSYKAFDNYTDQSNEVTHTYQVLNQVEQVNNLVTNMETGRRGFRATGDRRFLGPYQAGKSALPTALDNLKEMVLVPEIKAEVDILTTRVDTLLAFWSDLEKSNINVATSRERLIEITTNENELMDLVRAQLKTISSEEQQVLEKRKNENEAWAKNAKTIVIAGTTLILAIVASMIYFILYEFKRRLVVQKQLRTKNFELREKTDSVETARQALEAKAEELEQASRYKSEFLANMSHELRTPLNSILILSRLISENKTNNLNDKQVEYANIIQKSGVDLLNLINDILDLSKIEAGRFDMHFDKVDVVHVVNGIRKTFGVVAEDKSITFQVMQDTGFPASIRTDRQRLEQVIRNLLSNAFKFTPQGGQVDMILNSDPDISTLTNSTLKESTLIGISIKDNGIGIPKEKQALIFDAFQQAEGSTTRKYGGTGLGLSISRELIQKLGGEITVKSDPGKGSCFTIYLPVDPKSLEEPIGPVSQPAELQPKEEEFLSSQIATEDISALEGKKVLVVDDDMRNVFAISRMLEDLEMQVSTAATGVEAIDELKNERFDVVLMDIMMPEMDGYEATGKIRNELKLEKLPVIATTAKAGPDEKEKCMKAGASDYLSKPIDKNVLIGMLKKWITSNQQ